MNNAEEEINKSYNPFKMWGSWVGFILGFFWMFIESKISGKYDIPFIIERILPAGGEMGYGYIYLVIYMVLGFIIGWGVHSLIRKSKKSNSF